MWRTTCRRGVLVLLALALSPGPSIADGRPDSAVRPSPAPALGDGDAMHRRLAQGAMSKFRFASEHTAYGGVRLTNKEGGTAVISDYAGRIVLVNIWASWCAPCREEMPALARLRARLGGDGLEVITVSIDKQAGDAERFLEQLGVSGLPLYHDPGGANTAAAFGARGVPISILLDQGGREIGRLHGSADWTADESVLLIRAAMTGRLEARR